MSILNIVSRVTKRRESVNRQELRFWSETEAPKINVGGMLCMARSPRNDLGLADIALSIQYTLKEASLLMHVLLLLLGLC